MKRYEGKAFASIRPIDGYEVLGNRAVIYILENSEEFDKNLMSKLGVKENAPITCFVKNIKKNDFDISFWNLDGSQAFMCGHGSILVGNLLNKIMNISEINLFYDISHYKEKVKNNKLELTIEDNGISFMKTEIRDFEILKKEYFNKNYLDILDLMGVTLDEVKESLWCNELCDLIFVMEDSSKMRKMELKFKEIAPILDNMMVRNLCSTAKSDHIDFDFETRVFCPHDNLNEDIACGSSNMSIAKYWADILDKSKFNVLFPYHKEYEDKKIGGVQIVKLEHDAVFVGGSVIIDF
jgi:predicted PhzF superfamily epimerase YddE/YHI9